MANYVYNRVICNEQAKKQLENKKVVVQEIGDCKQAKKIIARCKKEYQKSLNN